MSPHSRLRSLTGPTARAGAILAAAAVLTATAAACSSEKTKGGISPAVVSAASEASRHAASAAAEASELAGEEASSAASNAAALISQAASARAASASAAAASLESRAAAFESSVSAQISAARQSASAALSGVPGTGNAIGDVTLTGIPTTATDGYPAATVTITNSTSQKANYAVQVDFLDSSGATVETVVVGTTGVAPGERRTVLAHGDQKVDAANAKVARAQRY
ncbi:FxLYD domain-containing protein [Kitasatospora sp. NPDC051914]|uniref:FxLYD domain-containing protein n=1 Tax=Kitasatospora sp. NPDC051914 TaxID=3154945 RepID=UPI00341D8A5A